MNLSVFEILQTSENFFFFLISGKKGKKEGEKVVKQEKKWGTFFVTGSRPEKKKRNFLIKCLHLFRLSPDLGNGIWKNLLVFSFFPQVFNCK